MCSKILFPELTVILLHICSFIIIFFQNLLAKMDNNTSIKTEPTSMADYEFEVNIYIILT